MVIVSKAKVTQEMRNCYEINSTDGMTAIKERLKYTLGSVGELMFNDILDNIKSKSV